TLIAKVSRSAHRCVRTFLRHGSGAKTERQSSHCGETKHFDCVHDLDSYISGAKPFWRLLQRGGFLIPAPCKRRWESEAKKIMSKLCKSLLCEAREYALMNEKTLRLSLRPRTPPTARPAIRSDCPATPRSGETAPVE